VNVLGRSHYPPAGTKNRRAGGGFVRFSLNLGCANVVFVLTQQGP
jgi:hypothetical protein